MLAPLTSSSPFAAPPVGPDASPANGGSGPLESFRDVAMGAVDAVRAAEEASAGALTGEVGVREAVDRVMEAERTLRTAVAVRDKLVASWLEVSRMAI